jgi:hypothetical protein
MKLDWPNASPYVHNHTHYTNLKFTSKTKSDQPKCFTLYSQPHPSHELKFSKIVDALSRTNLNDFGGGGGVLRKIQEMQ